MIKSTYSAKVNQQLHQATFLTRPAKSKEEQLLAHVMNTPDGLTKSEAKAIMGDFDFENILSRLMCKGWLFIFTDVEEERRYMIDLQHDFQPLSVTRLMGSKEEIADCLKGGDDE